MISRWLIHFFLKFVQLWNYFFIVSSCFKWVFLTVSLGLSSVIAVVFNRLLRVV